MENFWLCRMSTLQIKSSNDIWATTVRCQCGFLTITSTGGTHSNEYHFIVNMLYYYCCHNIVLVLTCLLARYDMHYETCLLPTICDMEFLCTLLNEHFLVTLWHEMWVKGHWRLLRVVSFDRLCMVSCWCSLVTLSLKCTVFEIFDFKNTETLKSGLGVRQGHQKSHHVLEDRWLPIDVL